MLSSWDDYPVHQVAEPIRHVGTSDRNFYDRYYFNCHACSDDLFLVLGMGQYPNLGTQDAFAVVRRGEQHRVVRSSRVLDDRMDLSVGPLRVEVVEPLRKVRFVLEPTEHPLALDLTFEGAHAAFEEPKQHIRKYGRVLFDTARFCQNGRWSGTLQVAAEAFTVEPDRWWGMRDRSWGVRPVGEAEPPGIRQETGQMVGIWNYAPMQFEDHQLFYICQEQPDGSRTLEEAVRVWNDPAREAEHLGRPEFEHTLTTGTRRIDQPSRLRFPEADLEVTVNPLVNAYVAIGTGYGVEDDWRHGMYQGDLVTQYVEHDMAQLDTWAWYSLNEQVARFEASTGAVGYGMHEYGFFGPFPRYGLTDGAAVAP
jgi:hypothetical protein